MHCVSTTNTWTVCIHFSSTAWVAKILSRVEKSLIIWGGGQFISTSKTKDRTKQTNRMPSIAKKRLLRREYKKYLLSSSQKTKSTQTSGSVFADRIEQGKKTKFELELIKTLGCFLDGHGNHTSNLVSFKIKSL